MKNLDDSRIGALNWAILSALLMSLAWHLPGSTWCVLLGWCSCLALVLATRHRNASYATLLVAGFLQHLLGFYWIAGTAHEFGGFSTPLSVMVLVLFALSGSLQHIIFFFFFRRLPLFLDNVSARCAFAWVASEFLCPRIFPWHVGHTQIGFHWFAQVSDLSGVMLLSFTMVWVSEALISLALKGKSSGAFRAAIPACVLFCVVLTYGKWRWDTVNPLEGTPLDITAVQANISTEKKGDIRYFAENRDQYVAITEALTVRPELLIWPETVVQDFIFEKIGSVGHASKVPYFAERHLLTGALTFRSQKELFNSALSVFADGKVPVPYHKQILMPFGEYMPLASVFPWIQDLNPVAGGLTAGAEMVVTEYPALPPTTPRPFRVASLICYEDIVPSLAREAVSRGAELLVNLTNDAWFGDTVASRQHHMIAAFRAIETRRYLIRSTNSGFTAIVDPRGVTTASLAPFAEGSLRTQVHLRDDLTPFTGLVSTLPWLAFSLLTLLTAILPRR